MYDYYLLFCKHDLQKCLFRFPGKRPRSFLVGCDEPYILGWRDQHSLAHSSSWGPESLIAIESATRRPRSTRPRGPAAQPAPPGPVCPTGVASTAKKQLSVIGVAFSLLPVPNINAICHEQLCSHLCTATSIFLIKKFIKVSSIQRKKANECVKTLKICKSKEN